MDRMSVDPDTLIDNNPNISVAIQNQLLATKFYVPVAMRPLVSRPRLDALLQQSQRFPLTLVSAPAGFGKTTLLASWVRSLPASQPLVAWVSLDEEDNDPRLFWTYVLAALDLQQPERFQPLLMQLQSPQVPPLQYLLKSLINLLADTIQDFLLVLDDYHVITEQQVSTSLSYLIEHLPEQLRIILITRVDSPWSFTQLRAGQRILEVRTEQLRCTSEETKAFFDKVMGITLPDETIEQVRSRTEGWLVGLQLLGLSQRAGANPATLLEEATGSQRYILDYLTEEVLRRQPQDVQTFLLSTCILERLSAPLCDAVTEQTDSQEMLERLEQANLFVISLDSKRKWYRYHALFAEALRHQLQWTHENLVPILHYRASCWYAQHDQITEAVLHAFHAKEWQWVADIIERHPLLSFSWGASRYELVHLRQWLEQLPPDVLHFRPRLCLACAQFLWAVAPYPKLYAWLDKAEARLTALLAKDAPENTSYPVLEEQARQEQENLLGEVIAWRAFLCGYGEGGHTALLLCQQALTLLSATNNMFRALTYYAQFLIHYASFASNELDTAEELLRASLLPLASHQPALAIGFMGAIAARMIGAGRLKELYELTKQAIVLGTQPGGLVLPDVGWPIVWQAEILRERNQLDAALDLVREAIALCEQGISIGLLAYLFYAHAVLLRIHFSRRDLDAARCAL